MDSIEHAFSIQLGTRTNPILNLSFVKFTIHFRVADAELRINEPSLDFSNSWLKKYGNVIVTFDTLRKHTPNEWSWDIAISLTGKSSASGFGEICKVLCIMDIIAIEKTSNKQTNDAVTLNTSFSNILLIDNQENEFAINAPPPQQNPIITNSITTGTTELLIPNADLTIYPNPALSQQNITIEYENHHPIEFYLYDIAGHQISLQQSTNFGKHSFNLPQLLSGIYFLKLVDTQKQTSIHKKLIVSN